MLKDVYRFIAGGVTVTFSESKKVEEQQEEAKPPSAAGIRLNRIRCSQTPRGPRLLCDTAALVPDASFEFDCGIDGLGSAGMSRMAVSMGISLIQSRVDRVPRNSGPSL
jgi:hypothetical protein